MSELDATRRERLTTLLRRGGQAVITTTELAHVPGAEADDVVRLEVVDGRVSPADGEAAVADAGSRPWPEARAA